MNKEHKKAAICLVICYFGRCPAWIDLFLASCKTNTTIDFLIFSDCISTQHLPANVTVINTTLEEVRTLASQKLGFEVTINFPYKLCDLKPTFGEIFSEHLTPYAFWGMTDLDVIFGNIQAFVGDNLLLQYDVINAFNDYLVGHFSLYRNELPFRSLFKESRHYKNILQTNKMLSFTECGGQWTDFSKHRNRGDEHATIDSMTHVVNRLAASGKVKSYFKTLSKQRFDMHKSQWLLYWDNGRLFDVNENREIMYFHFHLFKQDKDFRIPDWQVIPDQYYINRHGFFV